MLHIARLNFQRIAWQYCIMRLALLTATASGELSVLHAVKQSHRGTYACDPFQRMSHGLHSQSCVACLLSQLPPSRTLIIMADES